MKKTRFCLIFFNFFLLIIKNVYCKSNLRNISQKNYKLIEDNNNFEIKLPTINFPSINNVKNNKNYESIIKNVTQDDIIELSSNSRFPSLLTAIYLFSALCFILCLTGLNNHKTSKRGNTLGCIGIIAAVLVTFTKVGFGFRYELFFLIVISAVGIGLYIAITVNMIEMPQLVALFHSFVGLASIFVGFSKFHSTYFKNYEMSVIHLIELYLGTFIAAITFIGSLVAAGKLSGILDSKSLKLKIKKLINILFIVIIIILGYYFVTNQSIYYKTISLYTSFVIELFLGFHLIASIGAADMPVVISVLNSYSGFSTAISGFLLHNNLLIISGSLIGSSGSILSYIMCTGMNRDIFNIILGGWDDYEESSGLSLQEKEKNKSINFTTNKYVADALINAKKVVIVPGYGTAVSKCQRELSEFCTILKSRNIEVLFAIHPVAGRMPGHLNVLLAEANIPYNIVKEMSEINPLMSNTDIVLVVGANDIVNPSSLDPSSKIFGMPVIEVWKSKKVIMLKRSLGHGYSAIDNPLFNYSNTYMLLGDAKYSTNQILTILNDYASHKNPIGTEEEKQIIQKEFGSSSFHSLLESDFPNNEDAELTKETFPTPRRVIGLINDDEEEKEEKKKNESDVNLTIVPLTPKFVPKLRKMGFRVLVEEDIGKNILINNEEYAKYGAEITSRKQIFNQSNILLKVDPPTMNFINSISNKTTIISYLWPGVNQHLLQEIMQVKEKKNITYLAIDEVPRFTRAQKLDFRSSMSNLQGYRAILEAFYILPKFSKSSITAAGKINPAKVFVIGAGVAGLQAIITAKSLGAVVYAYDTKSSTEEEVKSCGGIFIRPQPDQYISPAVFENKKSEEYMKIQSELFKKMIKKCDILICAASIHGKTSPKLVTTEMIKLMKPGSVAVDLSTEFGHKQNCWGGNIECSQSNKNIIINGIHVLGRDKIERNMPLQASDLFSMNMINLLEEMGGGLQFNVDINNDIIKSLVVIKDDEMIYSPDRLVDKSVCSESAFIREKKEIIDLSLPQKVKHPTGIHLIETLIESDYIFYISILLIIIFTLLTGIVLSQPDLHHLFLFTLSIVIGYFCVWSITPSLHTPLMSVTNALSGIIIIGSMTEFDNDFKSASSILSMIATFLSAVNLSGGFYVTKRMLDMFFK